MLIYKIGDVMMNQLFNIYMIRNALIKILLMGLCLLFHWTSAFGLQQKYTIEVIMGVNDKVRTNWDGEAHVMRGTIEKIQGRFINGTDSILENNQWRMSSHIAPGVRYIGTANPSSIDSVAKAVLITLSGNENSRLSIRTTQGNFNFTLGMLRYGRRHLFLQGNVEVLKIPYTKNMNAGNEDDDYTSLLKDKNGTIWAAWIGYREGEGDDIFVRQRINQTWGSKEKINDKIGDFHRLVIAQDERGGVWLVWAAFENNNWDLYGKYFYQGRWSSRERITNAPQSDILHKMISDNSGRIWLCWQSYRNGNADIYLKSWHNGKWSQDIQVTTHPSNDWEPDIAADSQNNLYIAWDTYRHGDYDVYMRSYDGKNISPLIPVTDTPNFEGHVSLACDYMDRVWIAYEDGGRDWGKDYPGEGGIRWGGFKEFWRGKGFSREAAEGQREFGWTRKGLNQIYKSVKVKVYYQKLFFRTKYPIEENLPDYIINSYEMPVLMADNQKRIWLFFKHYRTYRMMRNENTTWEFYAMFYSGGQWSSSFVLPQSNGRLDSRMCAVPDGNNGVWAAWPTDHRGAGQPYPEGVSAYDSRVYDFYVSHIQMEEDNNKDLLTHILHKEIVPPRAIVQPYVEQNRYQMTVQGKQFGLYWGDLHRHTDISFDGFMDGSIMDMFRYAYDAGELDFIATTDHNYGERTQNRANWKKYPWWRTQKLADVYHTSGKLIPYFAYERSQGFPEGHRNIINLKRGTTYVPAFRLEGSRRLDPNQENLLWNALEGQDAISIPHTIAFSHGTDWTSYNPQIETLVELYQGCRNSYEYAGAPRGPMPDVAERYAAGFIWNALQKGYRIGFIASSDHESTHISYAGVYAEECSRESIFRAMQKRHTIAATDYIALDVKIGDYMVGDEGTVSIYPLLNINVIGTDELKEVAIIKDNTFVYADNPQGSTAKLTFRDESATPGWHYYYVRVIQEDEEIAWASPIWIQYKP